jgi:hypothetical protein
MENNIIPTAAEAHEIYLNNKEFQQNIAEKIIKTSNEGKNYITLSGLTESQCNFLTSTLRELGYTIEPISFLQKMGDIYWTMAVGW